MAYRIDLDDHYLLHVNNYVEIFLQNFTLKTGATAGHPYRFPCFRPPVIKFSLIKNKESKLYSKIDIIPLFIEMIPNHKENNVELKYCTEQTYDYDFYYIRKVFIYNDVFAIKHLLDNFSDRLVNTIIEKKINLVNKRIKKYEILWFGNK